MAGGKTFCRRLSRVYGKKKAASPARAFVCAHPRPTRQCLLLAVRSSPLISGAESVRLALGTRRATITSTAQSRGWRSHETTTWLPR